MTHGPGLIALSCSENGRYSSAHASIHGLHRPAGSRMFFVSGLSIAENWNSAARTFLEHPELEWIFLMNDDHIYPPDTLMRLLAHDVDVVTGLYCERQVPFGPILFDEVMDLEGHVRRLSLAELSTSARAPDTPPGLTAIVACGDGAMLVRRSVFEMLEQPFWTYGSVDKDRSDHDIAFCANIRAAGIRLWADLSVVVDHLTPIALRPSRQADGSWTVQLRDKNGAFVEALIAQPEEVPA